MLSRRNILCAALLAAVCAAALPARPQLPQQTPAPTRIVSADDLKKAQKAYEKGQAAESAGDWQAAFDAYDEAIHLNRGQLEYLQHRDVARSQLVQKHIDQAERDAAAEDVSGARKEMREANELDPNDEIINERIRELRRLAPDIPLEAPENISQEVHLKPTPGAFSFHLRGDTKSAYEDVARKFGLDISFDPDMRTRQVRLDADDLDFAGIMRVLSFQTGTFYRAVTPDLMFVAEDTMQKRREFDQSVVRTIPLGGSASPDQMTETFRAVRDISGVLRMNLDSANHSITVRASPHDAELVSELVRSLEVPRAQMVLEIEVLEVDRNSASQLGLLPPQSGTIYTLSQQQIQEAQQSAQGLVDVLEQLFGTPSSLAGYSTAQLGQLVGGGQLNGSGLIPPVISFGGGKSTFLATLPGAALDFSTLLSTVKTGQRVLLRAEDGLPATFFVGDRIPVSLAAFSASLGSSTTTPGVSTDQFPTANYPCGQGPAGITSGDLNNDGFVDLVTANDTAGTASVLLGNGDGTFQTNVDYTVDDSPVAVATGDFNGDGNLDVAVVNSCGTDSTCKSPGTISILLGNGDGTLQPKTDFPAGNMPNSIVVEDFNGDGKLDLAVSNFTDNTVSIFLGNGDGTFMPKVDYATNKGPLSVATADFNVDGFPDLAVADFTANVVTVFIGNGDGTFKKGVDYPTGNGPTAVASTDFNLDSIPDLAVTNGTDDTVSILLGNGDGTFGTEIPYITNEDPVALATGDVNVDGLPDILTVDKTSNDVGILINAGAGVFAPPLLVPVGTTPEAVTSADFNGDSLPDAAVANFGSNNVTVLLDSTSFTPSTSAPPVSQFPNAQYEDVGLKIKATPRLMSDNDVSVQFNIELKGLSGQSLNNIPVITNRSVEQTVRVKENQTSILAGFLSDQETRTLNGLPFASTTPLLAPWTTNYNNMDQATELLILVTPRQVSEVPRESRIFYAGHGAGSSNFGRNGLPFPGPGGLPRPGFPPGVNLPGGPPAGEGLPEGGGVNEGAQPGETPRPGGPPGGQPDGVPNSGAPAQTPNANND